MPTYLALFSYSDSAMAAMIENPADREPAVQRVLESVGARLETLYWMFGAHDGMAVVEAPDSLTMAAISAAIRSTGTVPFGDARTLLNGRHPAHSRDGPTRSGQLHPARSVVVDDHGRRPAELRQRLGPAWAELRSLLNELNAVLGRIDPGRSGPATTWYMTFEGGCVKRSGTVPAAGQDRWVTRSPTNRGRSLEGHQTTAATTPVGRSVACIVWWRSVPEQVPQRPAARTTGLAWRDLTDPRLEGRRVPGLGHDPAWTGEVKDQTLTRLQHLHHPTGDLADLAAHRRAKRHHMAAIDSDRLPLAAG